MGEDERLEPRISDDQQDLVATRDESKSEALPDTPPAAAPEVEALPDTPPAVAPEVEVLPDTPPAVAPEVEVLPDTPPAVESSAQDEAAVAPEVAALVTAAAAGALEDDVLAPPPGKALRSHPPPKPRPSEPPTAAAMAPVAPVMVTAATAPAAPATPVTAVSAAVAAQDVRPHPMASLSSPPSLTPVAGSVHSRLRQAVSVGAVAASLLVGYAVGRPSAQSVAAGAAATSAAVQSAKAQAYAEGKAAQSPLPAVFELTAPLGARAPSETLNAEPATRSMQDAIALGRHWDRERLAVFDRFITQLKRSPEQLEEASVRAEVLEYVADRSTSRVMLESLAELPPSRALDLLYEVWIGSKDRTETTQLAEALLLVPSVRKRASAALGLALQLREKPTDCATINQLVQVAIREGDRRSAMPLVNTSARTNCGDMGDMECVKCLTEPKDMRRAIQAIAVRPDPLR